jgi:pyruvate/2-oxoglutarate/acetoin dehydrogenase E1 component
MTVEAFRAAGYFEEAGVSAEVIDPVILSPLDIDTILESAERTGRLLVVDNGWLNCGASAEIITGVVEKAKSATAVRRVGFTSSNLPHDVRTRRTVLPKCSRSCDGR